MRFPRCVLPHMRRNRRLSSLRFLTAPAVSPHALPPIFSPPYRALLLPLPPAHSTATVAFVLSLLGSSRPIHCLAALPTHRVYGHSPLFPLPPVKFLPRFRSLPYAFPWRLLLLALHLTLLAFIPLPLVATPTILRQPHTSSHQPYCCLFTLFNFYPPIPPVPPFVTISPPYMPATRATLHPLAFATFATYLLLSSSGRAWNMIRERGLLQQLNRGFRAVIFLAPESPFILSLSTPDDELIRIRRRHQHRL
ncbi:hypothetical protein EI94DRAFT_1725168 [Lactarius quietus]|nr:hypothetical protein EI94DRAFT_1725168 [Lactarius quietus]